VSAGLPQISPLQLQSQRALQRHILFSVRSAGPRRSKGLCILAAIALDGETGRCRTSANADNELDRQAADHSRPYTFVVFSGLQIGQACNRWSSCFNHDQLCLSERCLFWSHRASDNFFLTSGSLTPIAINSFHLQCRSPIFPAQFRLRSHRSWSEDGFKHMQFKPGAPPPRINKHCQQRGRIRSCNYVSVPFFTPRELTLRESSDLPGKLAP
jgi:hypothetical protein